MNDYVPAVKKAEAELKAAESFRKRHPIWFWLLLAGLISYVALPIYSQLKSSKLENEIKELRSENSRLSRRALEQDAVIADVKSERNKAQSDLAPWVLLAKSTFSNAPPDKRLDLLLERVNSFTNDIALAFQPLAEAVRNSTETFKNSTAKLLPDRTLSRDAIERIKALLSTAKPVPVEITTILGSDSFELAGQIKAMFEETRFSVDGVNQAIFTTPQRGVRININRFPEKELQLALAQLLRELNQPLILYTNGPMSGASNLSIILGSK